MLGTLFAGRTIAPNLSRESTPYGAQCVRAKIIPRSLEACRLTPLLSIGSVERQFAQSEIADSHSLNDRKYPTISWYGFLAEQNLSNGTIKALFKILPCHLSRFYPGETIAGMTNKIHLIHYKTISCS